MFEKEIDEKQGIVVQARSGEDIESLIKRFRRKVNKSGILREVKIHSAFEKPGKKKKRKEKKLE